MRPERRESPEETLGAALLDAFGQPEHSPSCPHPGCPDPQRGFDVLNKDELARRVLERLGPKEVEVSCPHCDEVFQTRVQYPTASVGLKHQCNPGSPDKKRFKFVVEVTEEEGVISVETRNALPDEALERIYRDGSEYHGFCKKTVFVRETEGFVVGSKQPFPEVLPTGVRQGPNVIKVKYTCDCEQEIELVAEELASPPPLGQNGIQIISLTHTACGTSNLCELEFRPIQRGHDEDSHLAILRPAKEAIVEEEVGVGGGEVVFETTAAAVAGIREADDPEEPAVELASPPAPAAVADEPSTAQPIELHPPEAAEHAAPEPPAAPEQPAPPPRLVVHSITVPPHKAVAPVAPLRPAARAEESRRPPPPVMEERTADFSERPRGWKRPSVVGGISAAIVLAALAIIASLRNKSEEEPPATDARPVPAEVTRKPPPPQKLDAGLPPAEEKILCRIPKDSNAEQGYQLNCEGEHGKDFQLIVAAPGRDNVASAVITASVQGPCPSDPKATCIGEIEFPSGGRLNLKEIELEPLVAK